MATRSKVYIVNKGTHDFASASNYGDLQYITDGYIKYDNIRKLSLQVAEAIADSRPTDFLVLSGNNLLCVIVTQIWMKKHGSLNILHWLTRELEYKIIPLEVESNPIVV